MPRLVASALCLILLAACQPVPPYTVEGTVRDSDGNPIPNATVTAGGGVTATTDTLGRFDMVLEEAPNALMAEKTGWAFLDSASGQPFAAVDEPEGTPRVVTVAFSGDLDPTGTIVFVSDRTGDEEVHIMDADGSNVRRLSYDGGTQPTLSPDGQTVVYNEWVHLKKVPASGGSPSDFADDCEEAKDVGGEALQDRYLNSDTGCTLLSPAYNDDGTRIAYWFDPTNPIVESLGVPTLFVMDADGSNKQRVLVDHERSYGNAVWMPPTWSPTGDTLAFTTWREDNADVVLTDLAGNVEARFAATSAEGNPDWAPNGSRIYLDSDVDGSPGIWSLPNNGFSLMGPVLGVPGGASTDPVVSPDGALVAFVSDQDGDHEIYITDLDGVRILQVTDNNSDDRAPDWK